MPMLELFFVMKTPSGSLHFIFVLATHFYSKITEFFICFNKACYNQHFKAILVMWHALYYQKYPKMSKFSLQILKVGKL